MEYLEEYRNHPKIALFKVKRESEASHFYNLYCNHLLDRVRDGWIIFLDDDNMLSQPDTLKKINNNIKTENDIIFWKVKLGEYIIYPNIYDIKYGQIDAAGFCFHSKYKNAARWIAEQGSDFHYVTQLLKTHYLIRRAHSEILTQTVLLTSVDQNYSYLFHKYKLKIANSDSEIKYTVIQDNFNHSKLYAHLHCYDIDRFEEIYGEYIDRVKEHFNIIITYSIGNNIPEQYTILKIPNKGMDIGARFCMVHYLHAKNTSYTHILFLHSKSNPELRKKYFDPLIDNLEKIIDERDDYDGVFPDIKWEIEGGISRNKRGEEIREVNHLYRNQLLDYLNIKDRTEEFIEGNVYFLSKKVIDKLFSDNKLYNILNKATDFDYNYIINKYHEYGTIRELYNKYEKVDIKMGENNGNIEHSFERIVLNCCDRYKVLAPPRISIIYVYYERKNEQKNQTNLAYFIKYGLDKSRWRDMDITTLIIINGHQCEVMIPERDDIIVWKRDYQGEYDIGSYRLGIEYLEKLYNNKIYNIFNYLFIINAGTTGPIYNEGKNRHWLDPFLDKLGVEKSVICSPVINFLKDNDSGGPGPRCQTYCSLILLSKKIYNLLLFTKVSNKTNGTNNNEDIIPHSDYVLKKHNLHYNIILIGEYGLTKVLLDNGYNISCLIYDNINYRDTRIYKNYSERIDRYNNYQPQFFYKTIFIKNNWWVSDKIKDSQPVMYNDTILFINESLKFRNIYEQFSLQQIKFKMDYDSLNIPKVIKIENSSDETNKIKTSSKKEGYHTYGYSEEIIIWPKQYTDNHAVVIYCHYDKDNIVKDYVIHALKTLIILKYDIIFCTTSKSIDNVDLPFKVNYYKNKESLKAGNDLFMFYEILKDNNLKKYTWITFLNDSILLPIHGINNMRLTIEKYRRNNDFWGLYLSNEGQIHLCSSHIEFNIRCINKLKVFLQEKLNRNFNNSREIINSVEIRIVNYLSSFGYNYGCVVSFKELNNPTNGHCIIFNPINIYKYIYRKEVFGIKWKYISNYLDFVKVDNNYLNYLMRFLKTSDAKIPEIPNYFDYMF
jgi:hypothetical protein